MSPEERLLPAVHELIPAPPVNTALQAVSHLPEVLLLESAAVRTERGRYSFLMAAPSLSVQLQQPHFGSDPFAQLRQWSQQFQGMSIPELPPFQGGIAGMMAYELGQAWERLPAHPPDEFSVPVLAAGLYSWVITWDHLQNRCWIIAHGWSEPAPSLRPETAKATCARIAALLSTPHSTSLSVRPQSSALPAWARPIAPGVWSDFTPEEYLAALTRVIEYIHAGDIFQANMTQRLLLRTDLAPLAVYERLRRCNPAPFAGYYQHSDWAILSASPERFLQIEQREVSTRPIKGTRRRSRQAEADLFTRDSLRQSEKDQAENVMIVDLLRNDLSRVCQPGSIRVPKLCEVEIFASVQHLVSEIRGQLRDEITPWDVFSATIPGGSISGAPKVRAMEIISELEHTPRGPYTGSLFYVGHDGTVDSNLLIRTFVMRAPWLQCGVGGGIVALSDPAAEYEETWHKAAGMLAALDLQFRR